MSLSDPFFDGQAISNPGRDVAVQGNGIYVTADGNLSFNTARGNPIAAFAVVAGQLVPFRCSKILAATTASVIVGKGP
jgi:hypothetical protein